MSGVLRKVRLSLPKPLQPLAAHGYRSLNVVCARDPEVVVIGTGRSGTGFAAAYLTAAGIRCSHERFFTSDGPRKRNPERSFRARAESSWLAVPFLPHRDEAIIHLVRHPERVIASFYKIGFFDPEHRGLHSGHIEFAERYFDPDPTEPLRSCMRWYVEWNERCEAITDNRVEVENFVDRLDVIARSIGRTDPLPELDVSTATNPMPSIIHDRLTDEPGALQERLRSYPEFSDLAAMAERYGYTLG